MDLQGNVGIDVPWVLCLDFKHGLLQFVQGSLVLQSGLLAEGFLECLRNLKDVLSVTEDCEVLKEHPCQWDK